ncbi:SET and MYND domain-containing protein 4-like [Aphidius gifuensis]|uniref:SET and MYND domain-containing protein 4-like n=1 Tax=Aphidius gifuensis TaxID=684658 RepID=UPI001CDC9CF9|nr:SET and MYND domain-containing protein 4-like [Aphidius gifuensis]
MDGRDDRCQINISHSDKDTLQTKENYRNEKTLKDEFIVAWNFMIRHTHARYDSIQKNAHMYCKAFPGDDKIIAERLFLQKTTFKDKFEVAWKFSASYIDKSRDKFYKTVGRSILWRKTGDKIYYAAKDKDYLYKSIEAYTKSIAHAPVGSSELSLAYADRSAVLFKARLYEDCLLDIERSLKTGYPDRLKTKLHIRQALCFKALKPSSHIETGISMAHAMQWLPDLRKIEPNYDMIKTYSEMMNELEKPRDINKFSPEIKNNFSKHIAGASNAIDLKKKNNSDQHIIAKKMNLVNLFTFLSHLDQLLVIKYVLPIVGIVVVKLWLVYHVTVVQLSYIALIYVKKKAWDSYHNIECLVLGQLLKIDKINIADLLAIKTFLKALNSVSSLSELNEQMDNIDSIKNTGFMFSHGKLDANSIDNYRYLDYFKATSTECTFESALLTVLIVAIFGQKTEILGKRMTLKDLIESKKKKIFNLGKLMYVFI